MGKKIQRSEFSTQMRTLRRLKGLSQRQLAAITGISPRMIGHYESHVTAPALDKVKKIAKALGVGPDELLGTKELSADLSKEDKVYHSLMKRVRVIAQFPVRDQKKVFKLINELAEKNGVK